MKRLLICSPSHAVYGGVEKIVADLCMELPKRGWDSILALGKGARFNNVERYRSEYPDLPIVEMDGTKGTRQARVESIEKVIRKTQPDIVLTARIFDVLSLVSGWKKQERKPRLAVTIQAYEPQYIFDAKLFAKNLDLCVTSGEMIRQALIRWSGVPEDRVVSIPGGIRKPLVVPVPRRVRNPIRIGYVGRIEQKQKRIFDLIPFLEKLDKAGTDYLLDIVGTGPEEEDLKRRIEKWTSRGQVKLHGWKDQQSLYERFYPEFDCIVHFAHTEGVTIAPREAMIHGAVPIISEFTGLKTERQFAPEVNSLTFPVGDIDAAVRNLQRILKEDGILPRLSSNAMESQKGKYSFSGAADAWAEAFDQCLARPSTNEAPPELKFHSDGRLNAYGISPWLAQRIRDLFAMRFVHQDPGSEWPCQSGLMTQEAAEEILKFSQEHEDRVIYENKV